MTEQDIAARLRRVRKEDFGLSQEEMAHRIGVSVFTLQKWEMAKLFPSTRAVLALAREFRVSPSWLLLGQGPKFLREK